MTLLFWKKSRLTEQLISKLKTCVKESQWDPIARFTHSRMTEKNCKVYNSYPLYSLINGFTISEDGEYDIYFSPQKYVLPGLLVSGVCLVLVITTLVILKKSSRVVITEKQDV